MHEPGKYKVHDVGLQGWLKYQNMQPLYWERDEHGVMLIVYEKNACADGTGTDVLGEEQEVSAERPARNMV